MIYVVGIGPGNPGSMTAEAQAALEASDIITGYDTYIDLIREQFPGKQFLSTPMRKEPERCQMALEAGRHNNRTVSMICSGDPGVYGMAGLMLELAGQYGDPEIEIIPGVTAACSGAALLGAPLGHDFAVISLSDLLTPWELIARRLDAAGRADFCICLYNPSSKKRKDYLKRACEILLESRNPDNGAGIVRNIGRKGQSASVMTLAQLREAQTDMFSTVFIGNSQTKILNGKLVTPRGYRR